MTDFESHLTHQMVFSRATFGPGARTKGVIDHIRKELVEVEESGGRAAEWVDVVILAMDGLTRAIQNQHSGPSGRPLVFAHDAAISAVRQIVEKQGINELRDWPDWRTMSQDAAIEHVRGNHD